MSHVLKHNVADQIAFFRAYDTDGAAKTNLTSSTTGLSISVFRVGASSVSVSSLSDKAADDSTHSDGAIRNVGGNLYTIDLPDAATATQVPSIVVRGTYTGGVIEGLEHPVVAYDPAVNYASASKAADIESDTQDIQNRIPAALVGGRIDSYLGATANNVITHNTLASDCIANSQLATSAINAIQSGLATSTQATAIEADTQDIQSRLPAALVDGRMVSVAQVVSDKTGYKLASDGLALVTSWTVDITGSLSGSVGSISGVTFPANFGLLGIDGAGIVLQVGTVDELGASALTANSAIDSIANIAVLVKLDSMIEADGADWRYTANALEQAPAGGGGGGGTDWTSDERTAIRSILGIPASGTTPTDPSVGILDEIRDQTALIQSGGTVTVSTPVTSSGQLASPLIIGDDYLAANGRAFSWTVPLPSGFDASTAACKFGMRYEDDQGVNNFIATGTVTDAGGGNVTLAFDVARTVTGLLRPGWYDWSVEIVSESGTEITRVKSGKNAEWQEKQT